MIRRWQKRLPVFVLALFIAGCVSPSPTTTTEAKPPASLPPSVLAKYNDTFDTLREDRYETIAATFNSEQLANLKVADAAAEAGQLVFRTKTGCFSKRFMITKYYLRGDFDVQIDCHIDLMKGTSDMDQWGGLVIYEKGNLGAKADVVSVGARKSPGTPRSVIGNIVGVRGRYAFGRKSVTTGDDFHGTLRLVRRGDNVSALYRKKDGETWNELDSFMFGSADVALGFGVTNFSINTTTITAAAPIIVRFDNLVINAAQEIVESEI